MCYNKNWNENKNLEFSVVEICAHILRVSHLISVVSNCMYEFPSSISDLLIIVCVTQQFNINEWLSTDIGTSKQGELLTTVCQGLAMCGRSTNKGTDGADVLLEVS